MKPTVADWIPLDETSADYVKPLTGEKVRVLVARIGGGQVGIARYKPMSKTWDFPNAQMAFVPSHWAPMPEAPK